MTKSLALAFAATSALGQFIPLPDQVITFPPSSGNGGGIAPVDPSDPRIVPPNQGIQLPPSDPRIVPPTLGITLPPNNGIPTEDFLTGICCQAEIPECIACRNAVHDAFICISNPTSAGCNDPRIVPIVPPSPGIQIPVPNDPRIVPPNEGIQIPMPQLGHGPMRRSAEDYRRMRRSAEATVKSIFDSDEAALDSGSASSASPHLAVAGFLSLLAGLMA